MPKENRSCKDFAEIYADALVNCATCRYFNGVKCSDMDRILEAQRKEHEHWAREMSNNRPVYIG